jgi:3-oxoadipate enol-lactonase
MICTTKDQKNIFYDVLGNPESDITIVLLNGLSQTTQSWGLVLPYLMDTRIVVLDFIFQGKSDHIGDVRSFDTHSNDVLCVLEAIHCNDAILVGLSYGSLVAQHFAYHYPDKLSKMVLLSTFAHKTPYYESIETAWARSLEIGGYSLMFDVMMPFVLSDNYFSHPWMSVR